MEGTDSQGVYQQNEQNLYPTTTSFESAEQQRYEQPQNEIEFQPMNYNGTGFNGTTSSSNSNQNVQNMGNVQPVQQVLVEQVIEPEAMGDLIFAVIVLVIGLFVFPIALPFNIFVIKSKNTGARVIAYLSISVFLIELVFWCSVICLTIAMTVLTLLIYAMAILIPIIIIALSGNK
eukprot:gene6256-10264_t